MPASYGPKPFFEMLLTGMIRAYAGEGFIRFNSILDISEGSATTYLRLASQQHRLTETLNNMAVELATAPEPELILRSWHSTQHGFNLQCQYGFERPMNCHEFRYDGQVKSVSIKCLQPASTQPQDYHDKLSTTSEILTYSAALYASSRGMILDIGNPFYIRSPSWVRFLAKFIDARTVDLGFLRVNRDDPEEWDFVNPRFDYDGS
jgi:hypothetical protein